MDINEEKIINGLPFNPFNLLINENNRRQLEEEDRGIQFSHTLTEQVGEQLKAEFVLTDIDEDMNGRGRLHELNIPSFIMTRAIKNK